MKPLGDENWRRFQLPSYDCNSAGLDFGFRLPDDELFLHTSLYPGLAPLMSRGAQARYVNGFWSLRHGKDVLGEKARSLVTEVRRCPECWRESREEYGSPTYFRDHNMPGVSVCLRHGCALERFVGERGRELTQDCFDEVEVLPNAMEYARFCHDLLEAGIQCCLQDVIRAVRDVLRDRYDVESLKTCSALPEVPWVTAYGRCIPGIARTLLDKNVVQPDPKQVIALLLFLFGSVGDLEKAITTDSPISAFIMEIREKAELISEYRDTFVRVRCCRCGYESGTTPHSMVTGIGCPQCLKGISQAQMFSRQFAKVGKGYRCLTAIRSMSGSITIEKTATGERMVCRFSDFINFGTYGVDGYVPGFRSRLPETGRHPLVCTDEAIQDELSGMGNFVLEGHRKTYSMHWLDIRHTDCGGLFTIDLTNMRRIPRCRICQMKKTSVPRKTEKVAGKEKKDRSKENAMIWDRIAGSDGVIFNEDFHDIGSPEMVRLRLAVLSRRGLLQSVYQGVWCRKDFHATPDTVVDRMWIHRGGKRTGFPIGDSLLQNLGCPVDDPVGHFVTNVVGDPAHISRKEVLGKQFELRRCKVEMNEDNWMVLAVYYTVMFQDELSADVSSDTVRSALVPWLLENRKREEDFLPYADLFNGQVAAKVLGIARSLNTCAKE